MSVEEATSPLARLLEKYESLAALRRAHARGESIPPREVFAKIAESFPGALRELDILPMEIIEARVAALRAALAGGAIDPWIPWMIGYHGLMRAALRIKRRTARSLSIPDEEARALAEDASAHAGLVVDEVFVREVAAPPGGRIARVVYSRLETEFGAPADVIRGALFPRRP